MYNIKVQQAPAEFEDEQEANDYEDDEACTELIYASHTFHTTENDKKKKKKKNWTWSNWYFKLQFNSKTIQNLTSRPKNKPTQPNPTTT